MTIVHDRTALAREALRDVVDPELGVDIVALGLVYDIRDLGPAGVEIDMTLTTPGCPVSDALPREAEATLRRALFEVPVRVNVVWDPAWTVDRLTPEALDTLGFRSGR